MMPCPCTAFPLHSPCSLIHSRLQAAKVTESCLQVRMLMQPVWALPICHHGMRCPQGIYLLPRRSLCAPQWLPPAARPALQRLELLHQHCPLRPPPPQSLRPPAPPPAQPTGHIQSSGNITHQAISAPMQTMCRNAIRCSAARNSKQGT